MIKKFCSDNSGVSAIEWALIVALIGIVCILAFYLVGQQLRCLLVGLAGEISGRFADCSILIIGR